MNPDHLLSDTKLRHPDSYKWTKYGPEVLPMWIADMDFAVAPSIISALRGRLESGIGYHQMHSDPALTVLLLPYLQSLGMPALSAQNLAFIPGVVPGLYAAVQGLTQPGDEILTFTPIYPPFLGAAKSAGRVAREVPLSRKQGGWCIDWDALEASVTPRTRLLLLCHPHNPTGRVWTRAELEKLAAFALRHNLYVVSDELHAQLRYSGAPEFVPFASVNAELAPRVVTLTGPCKAYNTAGLGIGAIICTDPEVLARVQRPLEGLGAPPSALSVTMWRAALQSPEAHEWLRGVVAYLQGNRDYLAAYLTQHLPQLAFHAPQATYLAWLDTRGFAHADDMQAYLLQRGLALNDGPTFGTGYQGFVRLNFATSRERLHEGLERLKAALLEGNGNSEIRIT